nr:MAG TPA: hypothetical protein [Caudoviricetes sp.]
MTGYILIAIAALLILVFFFKYGGLKETLGESLLSALPKCFKQKGERVDIFLNGKYNRTATIDRVSQDKIIIYGRLPLPLDYRGRFYGVGVDQSDGSKLVYLGNRKHYRFVKLAELIRKAFDVMDEVENLMADDDLESDAIQANQESEVEDEK